MKDVYLISNQSPNPIMVKNRWVPPWGTAYGITIPMIQQLRITYGKNTIKIMGGPTSDLPDLPVNVGNEAITLPPPVEQGTLESEEQTISDMRKYFLTGRFEGMTHIEVAALVMSQGDRVVSELEDCTHILAGERPARSAREYAEDENIEILSLEDIT